MKYDFGGYATKNDLLCSDGRIIRTNAFVECDGKTVPLVWNHMHDAPENVLGHADLENRPDGVYAYCVFNDTEKAAAAKEAVRNGDICSLSIYANHLKQNGQNVVHGAIREVSLVLAGANPGAEIEQVAIQHSDDSFETLNDEAVIKPWIDLDTTEVEFSHSEETVTEVSEQSNDKKVIITDTTSSPESVVNSLTEDQKKKLFSLLNDDPVNQNDSNESTLVDDPEVVEHSDTKKDGTMATKTNSTTPAADAATDDGPTIQDIYDGMTDDQKTVVKYLIGLALEQANGDNGEAAQSDTYGGNDMYHNVFDSDNTDNSLSHGDLENIKTQLFADAMSEAKSTNGSFRDAVLEHAATYGITNIEVLFPDAKNMDVTPQFLNEQSEWVDIVMQFSSHTPFSRIKTTIADITAVDARAKGYVKGKQKIEEFFAVAKRETTPQTVYKKQKLDRDDVVDITDFDVVNWVRLEMRTKLNEELARAILIGDGRTSDSADKISEEHIRPISKDVDLMNVKVNLSQNTDYAKIVEEIALAHSYYRGTGVPMFFTSPTIHTKMLWVKDTTGRRIYSSEDELCAALRVSQIVDVPDMDTATVVEGTDTYEIVGIKVNLADYLVGADKGGEINNFDDFDIDYNQYKYLMETRCSGTLRKPWSAETIRFNKTTAPTGATIENGTLADLQ